MANESQEFLVKIDEEWYAREYPDVALSGLTPAEHYRKYGILFGRPARPSPIEKKDESINLPESLLELKRHFIALDIENSATKSPNESNGDAVKKISREKSLAKNELIPLVSAKEEGIRQSAEKISSGEKKEKIEKSSAPETKYSFAELVHLVETIGLFNKSWYLSEYKDVARRNIDPVSHYIRHGGREGRDPGPAFNTKWYVNEYGAEIPEGMNPLVHYCLFGKSKEYLTKPPTPEFKAWWMGVMSSERDADVQSEGNYLSIRNAYDIADRLQSNKNLPAVIIPVYNAPNEVDECLRAVLTHTENACRVIVIDDASPDPQIKKILGKYKGKRNVEIRANKTNQGFTKTVNRGIALAGRADVVFLNSDTKVTPGWLRRLRYAAYSDKDIGTVTPFSNNAGAFSAPIAGPDESPVPEWLSLDDYARAISQASKREYPVVPTGNGFCLYIKRDCLDEVGELDAASFPRGYGEENEFCMRAGRLGWRHIIDDTSYVYHVRSASFGEAKRELMADGRRVVDTRYPNYSAAIKECFSSQSIKDARHQVKIATDALSKQGNEVRPRILYVLSTYTGGTPQTNQDLMQSLMNRVEAFVLRCNSRRMSLMYYQHGEYIEMETHILSKEIKAFPHRSEEYDVVISHWLIKYAFELVHVRHIAWHGFGLIEQAKKLELPVVFSFHDFYTICPTVNLLDETNTYCGGSCTSSSGQCKHSLWTEPDFPPLKNNAINQWRVMFENVLRKCDSFVTTARSAKDLLVKNYPFLAGKPFDVIPHGRNFVEFGDVACRYNGEEKLRILVPGNISNWKGADVVKYLSGHAAEHNFEMHIMGSAADDLLAAPGVVYHGKYEREDFGEIVRKINPHIGAVFSISLETYCHTLTEMWSLGIPVLAYDLGAAGDRIKETKAGWLAAEVSPEAALKAILRIKQNPDDIAEKRADVLEWQLGQGTLHDCHYMAHRYVDIYRSLMCGSAFNVSAARPKIGVLTPNSKILDYSLQEAPASTHIRLGEKTRDNLGRSIRYEYVEKGTVPERIASRYDALLIQRTALDSENVTAIVDATNSSGTPIIFELDDDLLERSRLDAEVGGEYAKYLESISTLLSRASLVTVSTQELKERYEALNSRIAVVENTVSDRLWLSPIEIQEEDFLGVKEVDSRWAIYMGSTTHDEDLALLKSAVNEVRRKVPNFKLFTIGVTSEKEDWYEAIPVPSEKRNYPNFVKWLRAIMSRMDFGVAPLVDSKFNAAKSDLKFIEYSAAKLPALCSRVRPYVDVVKHEENGILVQNDDSSWARALLYACENPGRLAEMAEKSYKYAVTHRSVRMQTESFDATMREVIDRKATDKRPSKSRAKIKSKFD
ncbi:glycosyltransferase [Burkholderia anthina]|uniref:glycosyltransferase n=1 Tax=Burkholderia anthina TaxID=179879 RepID=UPI001CF13772|nr:glycosyltransferase [Burkholderia anthina]MCA8091455.1 glycosyltransferase [Burkholderia anthina]